MKRVGHLLITPQDVMAWLAGHQMRMVQDKHGGRYKFGFHAYEWLYLHADGNADCCLRNEDGPWLQVQDEIGPLESPEVVEELPQRIQNVLAVMGMWSNTSDMERLAIAIVAWARAEFGGAKPSDTP